MTVEENLLSITRMTDKEKETFTRLTNMLISQTFLLRDKNNTISSDYLFVENRLEQFEDYFKLMGWSIRRDKQYGVIYIRNESGAGRVKLDMLSTLILLTMRIIYEDKRTQSGSASQICTTVSEIYDKLINDFSALKKRPATKEIKDTFRVFENHNIISKLDDDYKNMDCRLIILPSILFVISSERCKAICETINGDKEESSDENAQ